MILWLMFFEYDFETNPEVPPDDVIGWYLEAHIGTKLKSFRYIESPNDLRVPNACREGTNLERPWAEDLRADLTFEEAPDAWIDSKRVWHNVQTQEDLDKLNELAHKETLPFYPMELHYEPL